MILRKTGLVLALAVFTTMACSPTNSQSDNQHYHPKGKMPSKYTEAVFDNARASLPFSDTRDFEEANKGFIAAPDSMQIQAKAGHVAWDLGSYSFLDSDEEFDSIHPSLQRQSKLNQISFGLYEVVPGIYQVRGFDLSNVTFIEGETGWIVFDPAMSQEPATAALELINEHLGERPVSAVIYSHSHIDHFGGVRGLVDDDLLAAGKVDIIAPKDFMMYSVSENVYAGNAMTRRSFFQYGVLLPVSPYGHAGMGLGQNVSKGEPSLIAPTISVDEDIEEFMVDGVRMIFQNTPDAEAPSEMNTYLPDSKALWTAENVTGTIHNIYTLRGAMVRDALQWSKYISQALYLFGQEAEVMFASHHWPRWGNDRIQDVLRDQRDAYGHLNNQVLHLANKGVTINEIHNVYEVPVSLENAWHVRGYHGAVKNNTRAVINRYLGFSDLNPTNLMPLSPGDSAPLYVEMMGGADKIMAKGKELYEEGKYLEATEILNKVLYAEPQNQDNKDLLADVFEQIGYQQETPGFRNSFLAAAYELRSGFPEGAPPKASGPDVIRAMSTELFLDFVGIRMDSRLAEDMEFTMNLITPDNGEKFVVELSNATLTNVEGYLADNPDLTLTIDRVDLEQVMMGAKSLQAQIEDGTAEIEGNADILTQLATTLAHFDLAFEILPGTVSAATPEDLNDFEVGVIPVTH